MHPKRCDLLISRLCGVVDCDGQYDLRLHDVHGAGGQRYDHDSQHRPHRQGVQEQGPHGPSKYNGTKTHSLITCLESIFVIQ